MKSGALVRVFAVELAPRDAYYLVCRGKDADKPQVKALMRWALAQYQDLSERPRVSTRHPSPQFFSLVAAAR